MWTGDSNVIRLLSMDDALTGDEWESMSEAERRAYNDARTEEYLAECSREERVRFEWENGS